MGKKLNIIVAMDENRLIGNGNSLPWKISEDLKLFKEITTNNTIIAGRKTFESFQIKPFPNRNNIVLSKNNFRHPGVIFCESFEEALASAENIRGEIFVVGGKSVYEQALPKADRLYISHIGGTYKGDVYFPDINWNDFREIYSERKEFDKFVFKLYERF